MNIIKNIYLVLLFASSIGFTGCQSKNPEKDHHTAGDKKTALIRTGSVVRLSPLMDEIIPPGELPEILVEGFGFTEGPVWIPEQNILIFSDIYANSIFQWSEEKGVCLYLSPSGYTDTTKKGWNEGSNGLLLDREGRLVLCQHGDRRIARMVAPLDNPAPRFITLADKWQGKRLNSPDDAVFNSHGDLYFTDPPYGLQEGFNDPKIELDFAGVFKLSAKGVLTLLETDLKQTMPNGIGLSPDETKLYIGNSGVGENIFWMEYDILTDGSLGRGRIFYDASEEAKEHGWFPDGFKIRKDGVFFASGPGGLWILSPDGQKLGIVTTGLPGQDIANCALDEKGGYLYMTAREYLLRIRLKCY